MLDYEGKANIKVRMNPKSSSLKSLSMAGITLDAGRRHRSAFKERLPKKVKTRKMDPEEILRHRRRDGVAIMRKRQMM
jgi:hypothetical protein